MKNNLEKLSNPFSPRNYGYFSAIRDMLQGHIRLTGALIFMLAILCCILPASATTEESTVIVPLKINTSEGKAALTETVDLAFDKTLNSTDVHKTNFKMTPRREAEKTFDYQASWPPSFNELQKLATDATRFMATGSLTRLGSQLSLDLVVYDTLNPAAPEYFFIKITDAANLEAGIDELVNKLLAHTGKEYLIAGIEPQGNVRIDSGAILHQVKSRVGGPYDGALLKDDLKAIFKMGYFDDVRIKVNNTADGKQVIFEIKEKPVIGQISVSGTKKLKEEKVREVITIVPNTIVNPKKIKEAVDNIKTFYKEKGFYNTEITSSLRYPKPERVDIQFDINEGEKIYIKEIRMSGNEAFKARKLKKVIKTSKKGLFSFFTDSGLLKKDMLEQDVARLSYFYHNNGYIDAKVGEPEVVQEGKWLFITFNISEGERYRVGTITLAGDMLDTESNLLALLKTPKEKYLNRGLLREDIFTLTDFYSERGYAFADVVPNVIEKKEDKSVDITLHINQGELVHLDRITIRGNTRTRDKVIRREMEVREKGLYNSKALRDSHQNLLKLDYFEEIDIRPEPTPENDVMNVLVEVKEKPTGAFSIGGGYSSTENLMFMGEVSQNNFLGKGQRMAFQANLSSRTTRYIIKFTEPHLNDSKLLFGFDLYNMEREFDDYTKKSTGGDVRFGYPIWKPWKMGFSYGYDNANLVDIKPAAAAVIKQSKDIHITSFVTLAFSRDSLDLPVDPSKGSLHIIETKYAGGPLGGDSAFTMLDASTSWFFPLEWAWDTTYHVKWAAGQLLENSSGKLPVFEKFYLGGINTIRGFRSGRISPKDSITGERIGGKTMWYMNNEWLFPLAKDAGLKGVLFFDCGNVYSDSWDFNYIKKSVGTGFRWRSPMGPLRIEWGLVIDPAADDGSSNWDFSIGGAF